MFNYVRHTDIDAGEPLIPEPGSIETEKDTECLKKHKTPATDQVLPELI
jgi:hypothetical protein